MSAFLTLPANAGTPFIPQAYHFASPVAVGAPAETGMAIVTISRTGSLGAINVVTQGNPNLDFTLAAGGSCAVAMTYFGGQVCTVNVTFQPKAPGERQGAVVLIASDNSVMGTELMEGRGLGSLMISVPSFVQLIAGNGQWFYQGDGGPATTASLYLPMGGAVDAQRDIFIADSNNQRIRKVDGTTGLISTVAGSGNSGYSGDGGPATSAMLSTPSDVILDGAGNLYIADSGNAVVRMVNAVTGQIYTVAGTGHKPGYSGDGGQATMAQLAFPNGLAFDGDHILYISDTGNNAVRRLDLSTGVITTAAGNGKAAFAGDGGPAPEGSLNYPWGIALGIDGSLYIADSWNNRIRKVDQSGKLSTVVGTGGLGFGGDGGPATAALLNVPAAVVLDVSGDLIVADSGNNRIRKVSVTTGQIITIVGTPNAEGLNNNGGALSASLDGPYSVFLDGVGNLYIGDMFHQMVRVLTPIEQNIGYDPMRVGKITAPVPVTLENDGNAPLDFISFLMNNSALDPATTTCMLGQPVASAGTCTLGVEFAPVMTGDQIPQGGRIDITSNAVDPLGIIFMFSSVLAVDPTLAALTSNPNPAAEGAAVTFAAVITTSGTVAPMGTVKFMDGMVTLGTTALDGTGIATLLTAALGTGAHSISAVYSGDSHNAAATSSVLIETVEQLTAITLTATPNPSMAEASVVFTATVAALGESNVMPGGKVEFYDGTLALGAASLQPGGVATFSISSLSAGTHTISSSYDGDANSFGSKSTVLVQTVDQTPTKTLLASSNSTVYAGIGVAFTSVVARPDDIIPTGVVRFLDGTVSIGAATLDAAGTAVWIATRLSAGTHLVSAVYEGDANNVSSNSASLTETVQQISTSTLLGASANPANAGAVLQLTAAVSVASGMNKKSNGGDFSGLATFRDGAVVLGTSTVSSTGAATLNSASLGVGTHNVVASYSGNTNYVASESPLLLETIVSATTSTVLTSSGTHSIAGSQLLLTVTVNGTGGVPMGTVTVVDATGGGTTSLGTGTLNANGSVTLTTSALAVGQHILTATYNGDAKNITSTSAALVQLVQIATSRTVLISSANPSAFGTNVVLTANVTTNGGVVTGTVIFFDGSKALASVSLSGGTAVFNTLSLDLGSHSITAVYGGDAGNSASVTGVLCQEVRQAGGVTLTSGANPSIGGTGVTFTATIAAPQGVAVTGTVTFEDGGSLLGIGNVNGGGTATFKAPSLTVGQHMIVATYNGDTGNQVASSSPLVQTVQSAGTNVTMISSVNPSLVNAPVLFTATVVGKGGAVGGAVMFQDGTTALGTTNLNAGVATLLVPGLSPGLHSIIAVYGGDANNSQSTSPTLEQSAIQISTVTLGSSQNPSLAMDPVTFAVKVSDGGISAPSGIVVFSDGKIIVGQAALDAAGTAAFTFASMTTGQHAISAAYAGDALNLPSFAAVLTQAVQLRVTVNSVTGSSTSLTGGQQITLISVVHSSGPVAPTGHVTFMSNGQLLGKSMLDNTGVATLTVNLLTSSATVTSFYSGDSVYATSTSNPTNLTVPAPTQFTMRMTPSSVTVQSKENSTTILTLVSLDNFADTLDLSCAGLPFAATCTFANDRVPLDADGVQAVKVVIDTGSPLTSGPQAKVETQTSESDAAICFLPAALLFGMLFRKNAWRLRIGLGSCLMLALLAGLSIGLGGCGGLQINGTPPGTYVFQITATGAGTGVMHAMDMTLTVTR